MRRVVLLAVLALALPTAGLASTVDYTTYGNASNSSTSGSAMVGSTYGITSPLTLVNGNSATGTVSVTTGTLFSCAQGLCFNNGQINITGSNAFSGAFNGYLTVNKSNGFTTTQIVVTSGASVVFGSDFVTKTKGGKITVVSGDIETTSVVPEPGTLGLLGTGLIGLAGIVRRKFHG